MLKFGMLSDLFEGAGAKYLTEAEVNRFRSNQHEFQGVGALRRFLGTPIEKVKWPAKFYWLNDDEEGELANSTAFCTWSDVRRNNPNRGSEYHLYYAATADPVVHRAVAGDLLVVAKTNEQELLIIICPANTTIERQLLWLFGLNPGDGPLDAKSIQSDNSIRLGLAARSVLDVLGISLSGPAPDALEELLTLYKNGFPTTAQFSKFARDKIEEKFDPVETPDEALVAWMEYEESLFRHLERELVTTRLAAGFKTDDEVDVDGFMEFSLSVHNRRKSRAGWALGHHLEAVLNANKIRHKREAITEYKKKPDFLFPGEAEYRDPAYNIAMLTMLGAKRTCKDRWRQVLSEANRIKEKHLLTLEPAISKGQTEEMKSEKLQLVVPKLIFDSYGEDQQTWLMDVKGFIELVKERQNTASS